MTFEEIVQRFDAKRVGSEYRALCPSHDDHEPSLSLKRGVDGRTLIHCRVGCSPQSILACRGLSERDLFASEHAQSRRPRPIATYDYCDDAGQLLYQVLRCPDKQFRQRRPNGTGGWIWKLGDVERVPYRLNHLKARPHVYIVEGEKDADRLWSVGLSATCNAGGASKNPERPKWTDALTAHLVKAGVTSVTCLPDNDDAGRAHMQAVARSCHEAGIQVRLVALPGLAPKGDVSDYLDAGHTDLIALCQAAPLYVPPAKEPTAAAAEADGPRLTDVGNAKRFARLHGDRVRYCFPLERWFIYDGRVWRADDDGGVMRLAKETVARIYDEAREAKTDRDKIGAWAVRSESADRLNAMIALARSELAIRVDALDADKHLLNCQNGTLDLRTYDLRPHRADDYITKILPVAYEPDAHSALWARVVMKALPDAETRVFAQKLAGMTCDGETEDVLPIVYGPTRTAKGTFQEALASTLGDYAVTGELDLFAERDRRNAGNPRPELVRLKGARMVAIYETSKRLRLSASLVKTATGNDPITARSLYREPITFKPQFTPWIATNHRQGLPSDDDAVWERVCEIPFNVTIPPGERDPRVRADLRDPSKHGAAILAWMVEGHRLWREQGLNRPEQVSNATAEYRSEMNPLKAFAEECCVMKADAWTSTASLRNGYQAWCLANHVYQVGPNQFQQALRELGCESVQRNSGRGWKGIGLIDARHTDEPRNGVREM